MATSRIELPNGTVVTVDGTAEEIERIIGFTTKSGASQKAARKSMKGRRLTPSAASTKPSSVDIAKIVNDLKASDVYEPIAEKVLDGDSPLNRVLLPLYAVHELHGNKYGLTSGEVGAVLKELGVPMDQGNISRRLSDDAKPYVIGDRVRVKGQPVRYTLIRRGVQYFESTFRISTVA
jgi:hypothetical protein